MKNTKVKSSIVQVLLTGEGSTRVIELTREDASRLKKVLKKGQRVGEWPDEASDILDRAKEVKMAGYVDTSGDCFGWYNTQE